VHWFDDKGFVLLFAELVFQILRVGRQLPGLWEKVVFVFEFFGHAVQVFGQVVLARELLDVGARIDALIRSELAYALWRHHNIRPVNVPVTVSIRLAPNVRFAADSLHYVIAAIFGAHNELLFVAG
jgi:hypothetical protein